MKTTNLKKILLIALGVIVFGINVFAGAPDDATIIILQTENQVKFEVKDQNQSTITEVVFFKLNTQDPIMQLEPDNCGANFCNYTINTEALNDGVYQIQVYVEGYSEPATASFVL